MSNLLALETFRTYLGYHPYHFWGLAGSKAPIQSSCNPVVTEYAWQAADAAGRDDIRESIVRAEERLRTYLHYSVAPRYGSITLPYPDYLNPNLWRGSYGSPRGKWNAVQLPDAGFVQALGTEQLTLIDTPTVTYSDSNGDGLNDRFTVTVSTTITDPDQIQPYFAEADRLDDEGANERWRIRPVSVSISGGTATIRGRAWQLVKPIRYEGVSPAELDAAVATNYVDTIDVYQRTTDGDQQATLTWETTPYPPWAYTAKTVSTDPAAIATATARVGIRDARTGLVTPAEAVYNADTDSWSSPESCLYGSRLPDRVTINYYAGYPLEKRKMAAWLIPVVARFAMAELARRICTCDYANRELWRWQFDRASTSGNNDETYQISIEDLNNPFGTRLGHIDAWKRVQGERIMAGVIPF
jgi:hypothetical protein